MFPAALESDDGNAGIHLREMQAAAAISMLHTQVHVQRRERERLDRAQRRYREAEESEKMMEAEYLHTQQLKRLQMVMSTNQIQSQRSWLEAKEAARRKPLTDVEKQVRKARAKIKCWPNLMASLDSELTRLQTELLPSVESKIADFYVLTKSTMSKCGQTFIEPERIPFLTELAANDPLADRTIEEILDYVGFFSTFLTEHTRTDSQNDLDSLVPSVATAKDEFDQADASANPLRLRTKHLRESFEMEMKPVRDELAVTVNRSLREVQACENEQIEAISRTKSEIQVADESIVHIEQDRELAGRQSQTVLSQTTSERDRIRQLKEDIERIEEDRLRTRAEATAEQRHTLLRRRVIKAMISARKERQEREAAQLEERVAQLSRHVAETDARWASDEFVRQRFRRSLLGYRLGRGDGGVGDEDVDAEVTRQQQSGSVTESDVFEAVKQLVEEREGGEEVDLAEARARVQCRFPYVWAARIDESVDMDAVFDRAFEAAATAAVARSSKGGSGRAAHVRWLLGEYGVTGEEMAGLDEEELERMLEAQQVQLTGSEGTDNH